MFSVITLDGVNASIVESISTFFFASPKGIPLVLAYDFNSKTVLFNKLSMFKAFPPD
jgi:hypothetical protein